jgi:type VI secretion system secreted protein VgrG
MPLLELSFASKEDSLEVRHFVVHEEISGLFEVDVVALSPLDEIDLEGIVGQGAGFAMEPGGDVLTATHRVWTGICSQMELVHAEPTGLSTYSLKIVPALWRTTLRRNNRIFQHLTIPDIVQKVLAEWQITPQLRLTAQYQKYEYRVQYGETDFALVNRLLEEAGIAYFFTHDGTQSAMVLSDQPTQGDPRPPLHYVSGLTQGTLHEIITRVTLAQRVKPGRFTVRDFDFRNQLDYQLFTAARAATEIPYELYDYEPGALWFEPGQGGDTPVADDRGTARTNPAEGDRLVGRYLDAERRGRRALSYQTSVIDLSPGTLFAIEPHPRQDITGKQLLVTDSSIEGTLRGEWTMLGHAVYTDVVYRPERRTPRPRVQGVQSAVVVGPAGDEIYTDEFGRVRVQLHWDREGKYDDGSTLWIRVSQGWAGAGYGLLNLPRVGQEVLVDFFEGNPDRPVITGRVFSQTRRVLYKLPDDKTKSGWKTETSPGAGGFNELSFEDAAGREEIHVQAQKDFSEIVKNDQSSTVLNDRSASVTINDSMTVGANQSFSVGEDQSFTIGKFQVNDMGESRTSNIAHVDSIEAGNEITGTVGPGVGYVYRDEQVILFTNGVASILLTPKGLFLDAKADVKIHAGGTLKLSGKQVVIDGKSGVYWNPGPFFVVDAKRRRLLERLKLIDDARKKAADMPPGPERDKLLAAADRLARNNRAVENARLAADSYNKSGAPPGFERLHTYYDPLTNFSAVAYRSQMDGHVVVAYAGTENTNLVVGAQDWLVGNAAQGAGIPTPRYAEAVSVARQAQAQYGPDTEFTGHSLGGGEAAAAALATGAHADTFNAAGLNPMSYAYYGLNPLDTGHVDNHTVDGEVLTTVQDYSPLPSAVGHQHPLPAVRMTLDADGNESFTPAPPDGIMESVDRHSRYIDGIEQQKTDDIATLKGMTG